MPASTRSGLGATPYNGGTTFRVWAPFATATAVAGQFNGWSTSANPLTSEGNGWWSTDVPGATVGQEYKYVLNNDPNFWKNDPYARELSLSANNSVIHPVNYSWPASTFRVPNWNELVIYELHIGTFSTSATAGGTFTDAISRLPYLRDLGINAVEVMAAGEFSTDTSMGYNPAYIFAIENTFGGINAFKNFVEQAHANGIAVIFDVVYNHLGPDGLDLWRFDGWYQGEYGGIYLYNDPRSWTLWGHKNRPDYGRGEIRWYLRENARVWLEDRQVDGLRWDATGSIRNVYGNNNDPGNDIPDGWSLMQWVNNEIDALQSWKISIAEDMQDNEWLTKDTSAGGAGFDAQWDARFVHTIRTAIVEPDDEQRSMDAVRDVIMHRFNVNVFERVIYTESHDEDANGHSRVPEEIWPGNATSYFSKKRSTLGAGIVMTAPGIPMLFQGQEFLEWGWFSDKIKLDWTKVKTNSGIVDLYRDLIHLRRNWFDTTRGLRAQNRNAFHLNDTDKVIAFHRWDQGGPCDDVIVVANMANRRYDSYTIGFPRAGLWKIRFNSDWNGYSADFGNQLSYDTTADAGPRDNMPFSGNIGIGAYTVIILSQGA